MKGWRKLFHANRNEKKAGGVPGWLSWWSM